MINLDTPGDNQLKPQFYYLLDLNQLCISRRFSFQLQIFHLRYNTHTSSHVQDRRSTICLCTKSIVWSIHHLVSAFQKISLGQQHWSIRGKEQHSFRLHGHSTHFFFLKQTLGIFGIFSIGRTQDIIPQWSKNTGATCRIGTLALG